jgi:hypothetical protein
MQININTDKTIQRSAGLDEHVETAVKAAVERFGEHITRVEVHLSDENSQKSADGGNRCLLEARVTGYQPIAVSNHANNLRRGQTQARNRQRPGPTARQKPAQHAASGGDGRRSGSRVIAQRRYCRRVMGPRLRGDDVSKCVGLKTVILAQARTHITSPFTRSRAPTQSATSSNTPAPPPPGSRTTTSFPHRPA